MQRAVPPGQGAVQRLQNLYCEVNENIKAYGVASHQPYAGDRGAAVLCGRLSGCAELYAASGSDEPWNSGDGLCFLKRSEKAGRKPWTAGCCNDSGSL